MWRITVSESNPEDSFYLPYEVIHTFYAMGTMDIIVRPPPVPRGAAARLSRAERAVEFTRRLIEAATGQDGGAEVAMPVTALATG